MSIGLESVVSYFPEEKIFKQDYAYFEGVPSEGMVIEPPEEKRVLARRDATEVMALAVAEKALAEAGLEPGDIDFAIADHVGGDTIIPGLGGFLHDRLGLRPEVPAWSLQNCCAGFLDGCHLGASMMRGNDEYGRVLVVVVSAYNTGCWGSDKTDKFCMIAGDGAAGAVISRQNLKFEILAYANQTYGELYDQLWIKLDEPPTNPHLLEGRNAPPNTDRAGVHHLANAQEWLETVGRLIARKGVLAALDKAGLELGDVDYFIPHQATRILIELWRDDLAELGVPPDKWRHTFHKYGMITAADHPATLAELVQSEDLPKGSIIAMPTIAGGGHCPTLIVKWLG